MTSRKQIEANRRNALQSSGPKTREGKEVVSRNALKHGLLTTKNIILGEEEAEFEEFRRALAEQLAPVGELEALFAERVVQSAWRLRRAGRYEAEMVENRHASLQEYPSLRAPPHPTTHSARSLFADGSYEKVIRYENHIERSLFKALHELQRLQGTRNGQAVAPPFAVDVSLESEPPAP